MDATQTSMTPNEVTPMEATPARPPNLVAAGEGDLVAPAQEPVASPKRKRQGLVLILEMGNPAAGAASATAKPARRKTTTKNTSNVVPKRSASTVNAYSNTTGEQDGAAPSPILHEVPTSFGNLLNENKVHMDGGVMPQFGDESPMYNEQFPVYNEADGGEDGVGDDDDGVEEVDGSSVSSHC